MAFETEKLEKMLEHMSWTGILEYNWENLDGQNPNHEKRWVLPRYVPGSAEFTNMNENIISQHPEMGGSSA